MKILWVSLLFSAVLTADTVLTLPQAYEKALKSHPGYQAEKFKTDAAGENINQVRSRLFPKIDMSASGGKYEYETYYNNSESSEIYKTYSISLTQPLYRPELIRAVEQSRNRYDATTLVQEKEAQKIALDTVKTYMELLKIQTKIDEAQFQKQLSDTKFSKVTEMLGMGLSNTVEFQEAKVAKDKALFDLLAQKRKYATYRNKLERLSKTSFEGLNEYKNLLQKHHISMSKSTWMEALKSNKDIQIANVSKKIAEDEINIRRYDHYPKADLSLGRSQNFTNDPVAHKYDNKAFIQISLPIYQGGYTSSRVEESLLLFKAAESNQELAYLEVQDRFEELWSTRQTLYDSIEVMNKALDASKLYLSSIHSSYEKGIKNQLDVMEATLKMVSIQSELDSSSYDMMVNEFELLDLTGALTLDNIIRVATSP